MGHQKMPADVKDVKNVRLWSEISNSTKQPLVLPCPGSLQIRSGLIAPYEKVPQVSPLDDFPRPEKLQRKDTYPDTGVKLQQSFTTLLWLTLHFVLSTPFDLDSTGRGLQR